MYFIFALSSVGRRVESPNAIAAIKKAEFSDEADEVDREHFRSAQEIQLAIKRNI